MKYLGPEIMTHVWVICPSKLLVNSSHAMFLYDFLLSTDFFSQKNTFFIFFFKNTIRSDLRLLAW